MDADSGDMAERSAPGLPYQIQYFQPPPYPNRLATSSSPFLVNCAAVPSTLLPPCPSPKATSQFTMSTEGAAHLFKKRDTTKLQYGKANVGQNRVLLASAFTGRCRLRLLIASRHAMSVKEGRKNAMELHLVHNVYGATRIVTILLPELLFRSEHPNWQQSSTVHLHSGF